MQCNQCKGNNFKKMGFFKNRNGKVQRYWCFDCCKTFSFSNNHGMRIARAKIVNVINLICENNGIRAIHRLTGLHQETILRVLCKAGKLADAWQREKAIGLKCEVVQCDEIHTFIHNKDTRNGDKLPDRGTNFTFLSIDTESRFVINYQSGQRNTDSAVKFLSELKSRVAGRFQLNTDAWKGYTGHAGNRSCIKRVFGDQIDHATEQKEFYKTNQFVSRSLAKTVRRARIGQPNLAKASTSYIERLNLSMRIFNRRFNRCTLGFSRKLLNHRHAIALFTWFYNFGRKHSTIRTTPAIAIGCATAIMNASQLWRGTK